MEQHHCPICGALTARPYCSAGCFNGRNGLRRYPDVGKVKTVGEVKALKIKNVRR